MRNEPLVIQARESGNWNLVSELISKLYRKKGISIDVYLECELQWNRFLSSQRLNWDVQSHFKPHYSQLSTIYENLIKSKEWDWQSLILKTQLEFYLGDATKAMTTLQSINTPKEILPGLGYLQLSLIVCHAQIVSSLGDYKVAFEILESANVNLVKEPPSVLSNQLLKWTEDYLFFKAFISQFINKENKERVYLMDYIHFTSSLPLDILIDKRLYIYKRILTLEMQPYALTRVDFISPHCLQRSIAVSMELKSHLKIYQDLLMQVVDLSKGLEQDTDILSIRSKNLLESFDWLFSLQSIIDKNETSLDQSVYRHVRLIECLYHGSKHTVLSLKLFKYLSLTFVSLFSIMNTFISESDKLEAQNMIDLYISRWLKVYSEYHSTKMNVNEYMIQLTGESVCDALLVFLISLRLYSIVGCTNHMTLTLYSQSMISLLKNHETELQQDLQFYKYLVLYTFSACLEPCLKCIYIFKNKSNEF